MHPRARGRADAPHYAWGGGICDGWLHLRTEGLSAIEERVPPGAGEDLHRHRRARQLFYVLEGAIHVTVEGAPVRVGARESLEVRPGAAHAVRNEGATDAVFLVVSAPDTARDREDLAAAPQPSGSMPIRS